MLRVEFHCHTAYSKDSLTSAGSLVAACDSRGIDRVIVTDHNTIAGARRAQAIDPTRVIVGEEIMTTHGELLAAFVATEIPSGLAPLEAIGRLREQAAFISVSHPFDRWRPGGWEESDLLGIVGLVDAIEVYNSRCVSPASNWRAEEFARRHNLPGTVGSDAHTAFELGRSTLLMEPFEDADGLRRAISGATAHTRLSPPWIHLTSRYATFRKRLGIGLDTA
jgi:predicted metal-dependent phosphoesterase TrpH